MRLNQGMKKGLFLFSGTVAFLTFVLILAGGLVTSHEAGLAVPDWPLSYGQLFPPMVGNVLWEHSHRMIAGLVGILTFLLVFVITRVESRRRVRLLAWLAFGAVVIQALVGGVTVIYLLPPAVSIVHAVLAQTFFCLLLALTYFLSPAGVGEESELDRVIERDARRHLKRLLIFTTALIYLQLILGAFLRHTGRGILPHVILAFLILIHIFLVNLRLYRLQVNDTLLSTASWGMGIGVLIQLFLGMGAFVMTHLVEPGYAPSTIEVLLTVSHQTLGAVILGITFLMTLRVWR